MSDDKATVELGEVRDIPLHTKNGVELFFCLKGAFAFQLDGGQYTMAESDIILCGGGQVRGAAGDGPNLTLRLHIPDQFLYQELGRSDYRFTCNSCGLQGEDRPKAYGQLGQILTRLMLIHYQREPNHELDFKWALLQMLSYLLSQFQSQGSAPAAGGETDQRIQNILTHIRYAYQHEITLQELADKEHISVHYLSRLFKRKMGVGFTEYLGQVRLAGAVNDLLHTRDSVIKIALGNGFSNVASFNRLFQKTYGQSPTKYRALRRVDKRQPSSGHELAQAFQEESDLMSYLRRFDIRNRPGAGELVAVQVDTAGAPARIRQPGPQKIVRVGKMSELLKAEVQQQLRGLAESVRIDYVHFACFFNDGMFSYPSQVYTECEYFLAVEFLCQMAVSPFFSISLTDLVKQSVDTSLEQTAAYVTSLLQMMWQGCAPADMPRWRFEITCPGDMDREVLRACYSAIHQAIRLALPDAAIGLQYISGSDWNGEYARDYACFISECGDIAPDFLALYLKMPQEVQFGDDVEYRDYQGYTAKQVERLSRFLVRQGLAPPAIMLLDWTTLSSSSPGTAKTFFRSAIIADEILRFAPGVTAMSFWLNYYIEESVTGKPNSDCLALYVFHGYKLPTFFTLQLLDLLYPQVIHLQEDVLVSRSADGALAILAANPCYFSPGLASDRAYTQKLRRSYAIRLENLQGKVEVEKYHMDIHKSAFYAQWEAMGYPTSRHRNSTRHLSRSINLVYSVWEETPSGAVTLSFSLEYNEIAVYHLRRR